MITPALISSYHSASLESRLLHFERQDNSLYQLMNQMDNVEVNQLQQEIRKEMDQEKRERHAYWSKKVQGVSPKQVLE